MKAKPFRRKLGQFAPKKGAGVVGGRAGLGGNVISMHLCSSGMRCVPIDRFVVPTKVVRNHRQ